MIFEGNMDIAIGELSRQTHCNIETIRYYERIGLLPQPHRQGGRFRRYGAPDIGRLRFIRRARQLGFSLDDVRALLRLAVSDGADVRAEARSVFSAHVDDIRAKIADLRSMERVLAEAIRECAAGRQPECPLINVLSGDEDAVPHVDRRGAAPRWAPKPKNRRLD
jgi:MerR family transcriptional regulator, mercuric resistance operon regulatory protein